MTDKQPEAMRLANNLLDGDPYNAAPEAAAELRRLHEANQAMLYALWVCAEHNALYLGENHNTVIQARAAITKGEQS